MEGVLEPVLPGHERWLYSEMPALEPRVVASVSPALGRLKQEDQEFQAKLGTVAHACNPSYLGDRDLEDLG
jgi:hypothetical protein